MTEDENNNYCLRPHPGKKKKSIAWDFFLFRQDQNGKLDTSVAICKICHKSYANKGMVSDENVSDSISSHNQYTCSTNDIYE